MYYRKVFRSCLKMDLTETLISIKICGIKVYFVIFFFSVYSPTLKIIGFQKWWMSLDLKFSSVNWSMHYRKVFRSCSKMDLTETLISIEIRGIKVYFVVLYILFCSFINVENHRFSKMMRWMSLDLKFSFFC